MKCYIGIDLGTSSVRALAVDERGTQLAVAGSQFDVLIPRQGWAEQNPSEWFQKTCEVLKRAIADSGVNADDIEAVSFSGQMHGLVPLKKDGEIAHNAIIWLDQRSRGAIDEIYALAGREWITARTLNSISAGFLIASLYWVKTRDAELYKNIAHVLLPKDYIKYRLCGEMATDYSDAAGSLAFNNAKLEWSRELLSRLDIDARLFPRILKSTDVLGHVTAEAAKLTGLSTKTLVVSGGADQCMQAIGNGLVTPGDFSSNIGTAGQVSTIADFPAFDPLNRTNTFAHAVENRWNVMGACLNSGLSRRWFSKDILKEESYKLLDAEAGKVAPGCGGLIFLPYLTGERTPHMDAAARGMFFGLTLAHGRADMERAVMEGVVFALKDCLNLLLEMGLPCNRVIAAGGGARSDLWLGMQADIFEKVVYRSASSEQACLGAALTAAVGAGMFKDYKEACEAAVKPAREAFYPDEKNARAYRETYEVYKALYPANKALFKKVGEIRQA